MLLRAKNLNLLPILQALLKEVSVARAAEQVCLSQSAVSGALARLREDLDDPLLVRVGQSMRLTPRAERLRRQLDRICADVEELFQPERFDPATAQCDFVVAAPDYLVFLLSGVLLARLRAQAPSIRVRFVDVPIDLPAGFDNGSIDLAVCANFGIWPELRFEHLFRDRMVAAVSHNHPLLARQSVNSSDLLAFPSLSYLTANRPSKQEPHAVTGIPSLDWLPQVSAAQFIGSVILATESQFVARAPASLVQRLSALLPLVTIELTCEETELVEGMFWSTLNDNAVEHQWLRSAVREALVPLEPTLPPPSG